MFLSMGEAQLSASLGKPAFNQVGIQVASAIDDVRENIYFTGGSTMTGTKNNGLTKYNITTKTWTQLAPNTLVTTDRGVMVFLNNKLYYFNRDEIAIYDIAANTWSYKAGVPYGQIYNQYGGSGFVRNGLIYIVSRDSASSVPGLIVSWNPTTSAWATVYTAPANDTIWLYNRSTVVDDVVYISNSYLGGSAARWSFTTGRLPNLVLSKPVSGLGVVASSGNWVYFGVGQFIPANPTLQKTFIRYNVVTQVFEDLPLPPIPSADTCNVVVSNNAMYLYAGYDWGSNTTRTDRLWSYKLPDL